MAKPWGRIELDYINHDKFRAINSNAICLWHEGKNYCDLRLTDGLIPKATASKFRFYSKKALDMLTTSAGLKPGTSDIYAPLWEAVDGFGWKMHDYLGHNDCREKVLARIGKREAEQQADRDRKAAARAVKEQKMSARNSGTCPEQNAGHITGQLPDKPPDNHPPSGSIQKQLTETERTPKTSGGSRRPIYTSDRFVVFDWQLEELCRTLGPHVDTFDLHAFFDALSQRSRAQGLVIPSDRDARWQWLQAQVEVEAQRRGLPMAAGVSSYDAELAALVAKGPSKRP